MISAASIVMLKTTHAMIKKSGASSYILQTYVDIRHINEEHDVGVWLLHLIVTFVCHTTFMNFPLSFAHFILPQ